MPDLTIEMKRKFPSTITLNATETKFFKMPLKSKNGDFIIADDIEIQSNVFLHAGLYRVDDKVAYIPISNDSTKDVTIALPETQTEINNFETMNVESAQPTVNKNLFENLRLDHLNSEEKKVLLNIIANNQNCFYTEGTKLTCTDVEAHRIRTKDDVPIYAKNYRYPFCHKDEVKNQIKKMLEQEIIRPSNSPWSSPSWVVPKKPMLQEKRNGDLLSIIAN